MSRTYMTKVPPWKLLTKYYRKGPGESGQKLLLTGKLHEHGFRTSLPDLAVFVNFDMLIIL